MPAVATILLGLAVTATILALIVIVIGRDPTSWYRGLSLDFPYYVWRTKVVSALGLHALNADVPGINLERPGFPVLASLLGSVVRVDTVTLVHTVQVATTVGVGLAAGAFAVAVLGEPRWAFPVFTLMTAASAEVAWTSLKSLDNLLVDAVVIAIAVAALCSATGTRGRALAIAGFASVALIHWFFGGLFLVLLAGVTLVLIPWSIVAWRRGQRPLQTPSARLGATVAGGALAGAFALFALAPGSPAGLPPTQGNRGNTKRLPTLRLPITGPLAALGAIALWFPADTRRRLGLVFLASWSLSVPVAVLASEFIDQPIKVFRVAGFALAIPILGSAALVGAVRLGRRYGTTGLVVGALVVVAGLAFSVATSVDVYRVPTEEGESASKLDQVRAAGAYLETVPEDRPAVFLISIRNPFLVDRLVRAGLPSDRILRAHLYWGGVEDLLAKQPGAQGADPRSARIGRNWFHQWWDDVDAIVAADPVVFYLSRLNSAVDPPASAERLARGVLLVNGPAPRSRAPASPLGTSWPTMLGASIAVLLLLGLVGSGWTRWLLPVEGLAWLGLSPAVGIAALTLIGTALARLDVLLGGVGGVLVILAIAAVGWVPRFLTSRERSDDREDVLNPTTPDSVDTST
jgi:hypothetical protein